MKRFIIDRVRHGGYVIQEQDTDSGSPEPVAIAETQYDIAKFFDPSKPSCLTPTQAARVIGDILVPEQDLKRKISFIKAIRSMTGCGLKEAKTACDNWCHDHNGASA